MTTVRVDCQACGGIIERPIEDVVLLIDRETSATTLRFECPGCLLFSDKPVSADKARELILAGVRSGDARMYSPSPTPPPPPMPTVEVDVSVPSMGPPLTYDDLLDFHLALKDWDGRIE